MPTVEVDTSAFEVFQTKLVGLIESDSIPQVAETHKRIILKLTDEGADAMGEIFHPYSPAYAKVRANKYGLGSGIKDLRVTGGLLDSISLEGDTLTVDDKHQRIALGQMTGHDHAWAYVHDFFDVSEDTNDIAARELAEHIKSKI